MNNLERRVVDPLFWPKCDRGYQEIMHEHSDTVYKYTP